MGKGLRKIAFIGGRNKKVSFYDTVKQIEQNSMERPFTKPKESTLERHEGLIYDMAYLRMKIGVDPQTIAHKMNNGLLTLERNRK